MVAETASRAVALDQGSPSPLTLLAAPTTGKEFNTLGERLIPKGCFRIDDVRFEFDSSFVLPEVADEMPLLADLRDKHQREGAKPPLSIFGHADPVGNDDYNKQLSGRRAMAIYAMLVRDVDRWEELFTKPFGGDHWGDAAVRRMLGALGFPPGNAASIKEFQKQKGLGSDGVAGPNTRKALYRAYMDLLCGPRLELDKEKDFLGRNQDADGKGDFQGCSEFNPILIFSQEEETRFRQTANKTKRNLENAPNRRVMILLFAPGRRVKPSAWPCPRAKEGVAACKKRFFPDAEVRRSVQAERREFEKTKNTFACRFYQLISDDSPCERVIAVFRIRLFDRAARPLPFAPCVVTEEGKAPRPDRASGLATSPGSTPAATGPQDAFIILRNLTIPTTVNVKWNRPSEGDGPGSPLPDVSDDFEFEMNVFVDISEANPQQASLTRLKNLGYIQGPEQADDIRTFQRDYKPRFPDITIDGTLNPATMDAIKTVHDACDPVLKGQGSSSAP